MDDAIGQGGFAVIDMRDNGKISDVLHAFLFKPSLGKGAPGAFSAMIFRNLRKSGF
jgi:hypothetical protein